MALSESALSELLIEDDPKSLGIEATVRSGCWILRSRRGSCRGVGRAVPHGASRSDGG
jgi:hypothetical protein